VCPKTSLRPLAFPVRADGAKRGGGIVNTGTLFVINSTLDHNRALQSGGGISNNPGGKLNVINSTLDHNSAQDDGGGIYNDQATVIVSDSTFDHNSASNSGGGISSFEGKVTVTNSTFAGNSATFGGGIYSELDTLDVINCTFAGNRAIGLGGGIYNDEGTVTMTNSIIAWSPSGGNCAGDAVSDSGHNLEDADTCGLAGPGCAITGGTSFCKTTPGLASGLADNGGPTQTIAVLTGSPAINAGDDAVCAADPVNGLDQRGYARPGGGFSNCTIGAYEYLAVRPRYQGPALSPVGLLGLGLLLLGAGGLSAHRRARTFTAAQAAGRT
jgi:predicted outer membrane repeat protein